MVGRCHVLNASGPSACLGAVWDISDAPLDGGQLPDEFLRLSLIHPKS